MPSLKTFLFSFDFRPKNTPVILIKIEESFRSWDEHGQSIHRLSERAEKNLITIRNS